MSDTLTKKYLYVKPNDFNLNDWLVVEIDLEKIKKIKELSLGQSNKVAFSVVYPLSHIELNLYVIEDSKLIANQDKFADDLNGYDLSDDDDLDEIDYFESDTLLEGLEAPSEYNATICYKIFDTGFTIAYDNDFGDWNDISFSDFNI
jgi:hypothetical protein